MAVRMNSKETREKEAGKNRYKKMNDGIDRAKMVAAVGTAVVSAGFAAIKTIPKVVKVVKDHFSD